MDETIKPKIVERITGIAHLIDIDTSTSQGRLLAFQILQLAETSAAVASLTDCLNHTQIVLSHTIQFDTKSSPMSDFSIAISTPSKRSPSLSSAIRPITISHSATQVDAGQIVNGKYLMLVDDYPTGSVTIQRTKLNPSIVDKRSRAVQILQEDVQAYAVYGGYDPIHWDPSYVEKTRFGEISDGRCIIHRSHLEALVLRNLPEDIAHDRVLQLSTKYSEP